MWVRKTDLEKALSARRKRISPVTPIFFGIFFGLFTLVYDLSFVAFISGGLAGFVLVYVYQLIFGDRGVGDFAGILITGGFGGAGETRTHFCPKCHTTQPPNQTGCSKCGKLLENFDDWHWKKTQ